MRLFFAAALLTALVILFFAALIVAEKNSAATGLEPIRTPFALTAQHDGASITVNDRTAYFSLAPILTLFKAPAFWTGLAALLLL